MKTLAVLALLIAGQIALFGQSLLTTGSAPVDVSQVPGNETDPSIVISPLNSSNMFVVSALDGVQPGLFVAASTNMGATWTTNIIATNDDTSGLTAAYGEPSAAWDSYGNLWVAYLPAAFEGVSVILSTNGGSSFAAVTNLAALDSTDQPRISAPPSGAAAGSAWVLYKDYTLNNTPLVVQGVVSTNLGQNSGFGPQMFIPDTADDGFADIAAGPAGQLMVTFQDSILGPGPASIYISLNSNALTTNGLGTNFELPTVVAMDAIGGAVNTAAEPTGIGLNSAPGIAWDQDAASPYFGRAYLVYTAFASQGNLVIETCYSTNNGSTWSPEMQVDDDTNGANDHFFPRVAVDPSSGIVGYAWFDCRNDAGTQSQTITTTSSVTLTISGEMVTNAAITMSGDITNNSSVQTNFYDLSGGGGSNILVTITGDNINGTLLATNSSGNVFMYGGTNTNTVITFEGVATNVNAKIKVTVANTYPNAFTTGKGDAAAMVYTTISTNGTATLFPNQPAINTNSVSAPATGFVSSLAGSDSLTGWGHYIGLAAAGANFFPAWPDTTDMTGNNPDGPNNNFDINTLSGTNAISITAADVSVFVTNSPNPVISEGVLVYSVVVSNNGPKASGAVTLIDVLPTNVTLEAVVPALGVRYVNNRTNLVFSINSMKARTSVTNTIRVTATSSAWATNFASAYGTLLDLAPANNTNQLVLLIAGEDLAMGMSTSETNASIGDIITNTIVVTNLGPSTNGPVMVTNILSPHYGNIVVETPGTYFFTNAVYSNTYVYLTNEGNGPIYLEGTEYDTDTVLVINLGWVPTNKPVTSTVTAQVLSYNPYAYSYATVWSQDVDTNLFNNTAVIDMFVYGEDLAAGLSAPSSADEGVPFTSTVTVTNLGVSDSGDIMATEVLSTNLSQITVTLSQGTYLLTNAVVAGVTNPSIVYNLGTLTNGQTATLSVSAVPTGPLPSAFESVSVWSSDFDTNMANNAAAAAVAINGEDLAVGLAGPTNVIIGQYANYSFDVTNLGLSTNAPVTAVVTLSTNLGDYLANSSQGTNFISSNEITFSLGALNIGQVAQFSVSALGLTAPTSAVVSVTVSSQDYDSNLVNNAAVSIVPLYGEDLALGFTASRTSFQIGQNVVFTTWVTNLGLATNGIVLVTNVLPANVGQVTVLTAPTNYTVKGNTYIFNLGTISAGQTTEISLNAIGLSTGNGTVSASTGSGTYDPNTKNNKGSATVTVVPALPMISNLVVTPFAQNAFISFKTGAAATAQVQYGLTPSYGSMSSISSIASSNHVVLLSGLTGDTNYYFQVLAWVGTNLYTTNGTFSTVETLILPTQDAIYSGLWTAASTAPGFYGTYYQTAQTTNSAATSFASYIPSIATPGNYNISIWYPEGTNFTTNGELIIAGATNQVNLSVNQTTNGGGWLPLVKSFYFATGTGGSAVINNGTGETNRVVAANAMEWVYDTAQDSPSNGSVPAWWSQYYFKTNVSGASDFNGDGYSNYAKYVLGLDPTNAADMLNFSVSYSTNSVTVEFSPRQGGRTYTLLASSDLANPVWTVLTNAVTFGTNGDGVFTIAHPSGIQYYQLSVGLNP